MSDPLWAEQDWQSLGPRSAVLWRGVEAQHRVATMKLVDTLDEQQLLEQILEASKPALPRAAAGRHYLLASPFRYPSPHPSRFRPAGALGTWYGAEKIETACTELAYWRWRFLTDSAGLRAQSLIHEFTLFKASVAGHCLDLTAAPWDARRSQWTADDYSACQTVAQVARQRGVQWLRYWSARHVAGCCAAVFDVAALSGPDLASQQTWVCKVSAGSAFMRHDDAAISLVFPPAPAV